MSTSIRLTRMGRKKRPFYRLVVTDSRNRRDGAYLANLGYYNPFVEPLEVRLHEDEIIAWLRKGARVSSTARALMRREGILYRWELERQGLPADEVAARVASWKADAAGREQVRLKKQAEAAEKARREAEEKARREAEEAAKAEAEAAAAAESEAAEGDSDAGESGEAAGDAPAGES